MMKFSILRGIVDNDPKGKTGRGTIFYAVITTDTGEIRYEWGLLEEIAGKFNLDNVIAPYRKRYQELSKEKLQ